MQAAIAKAHANIALAKYWGKLDGVLNLPAVPSLSLTLESLWTRTSVQFDEQLAQDSVDFNGKAASVHQTDRVSHLLDKVRSLANLSWRARVSTANNFPTASGLASSASGFAALAAAASQAAALDLDLPRLSALARRSSASAARSIFGNFVVLPKGTRDDDSLSAEPLNIPPWDICMLIVIVDEASKALSSTDGMLRTTATSPYYKDWLIAAPQWFDEIRMGVLSRDLERVGRFMELSTFAMHASAMAAYPPVLYWKPATLQVLDVIYSLRHHQQIEAWCTMDAGAHVKVLTTRTAASRIAIELRARVPVHDVLLSIAGPSVEAQ